MCSSDLSILGTDTLLFLGALTFHVGIEIDAMLLLAAFRSSSFVNVELPVRVTMLFTRDAHPADRKYAWIGGGRAGTMLHEIHKRSHPTNSHMRQQIKQLPCCGRHEGSGPCASTAAQRTEYSTAVQCMRCKQ